MVGDARLFSAILKYAHFGAFNCAKPYISQLKFCISK